MEQQINRKELIYKTDTKKGDDTHDLKKIKQDL